MTGCVLVELILRETIDHLGRRGEVVKVANGYARNYLLPQKLALLVTPSNERQIEREREAADLRESEERKTAQSLADRVADVECVIARRVGDTDTLYGSVTSADIADALNEQQLSIDKRKIQLKEPLKELGEFMIPVKIHREVTANVKVRIITEAIEGDSESAASSS